MRKTPAWMALIVAVVSSNGVAQDARGAIDEASRTIGAAGLASITFSGAAAEGNFGQSRTISFGLASTSIANYRYTIDFSRPAAHATGATTPPAARGGPPPVRGTLDRTIAPGDPWTDQFEIWVTPWGFLRGAAEHAATLRTQRIDGTPYQVVTWSPSGKAPSGQAYRVVGYINPEHLVDRVETWVEHPIFGDMHVETFYTAYRDFGGVKVPTRVARRQVGMETFVAAINEARANPPDLEQLMAASAPAAREVPAAPAGGSEKLAEGVYRLGGAYTALLVEFRDHLVVVEGGESEARGLAIMAEAARLFPGKRIRYVVNTHPHFDHASGLPAFAAEDVTILTDDPNRYFLEQALRSPRTLVGDRLARSRRKANVESVVEKRVLSDATRTLELHHLERLEHSDGMLVALLPRERILFTADIGMPEPGQPAGPALVTLVDNLERLKLDFDRHVTVHPPDPDRGMSMADLRALVPRGR